jgi:hypothetical protein
MRPLLGILLILHGLAHAGAGMWAAGPVWLITLLWWLATTLYIGAGLGVMGVRRYADFTTELAFAAVIPSALLLGAFTGFFVIPGILLDLALLWAVLRLRDRIEPMAAPLRYRGTRATTVAMLFLVYTSGTILLRPWAMRFGAVAAEPYAIRPSFAANLVAPVRLLVLEPAHFIMQRGMLRGVKRRAEG